MDEIRNDLIDKWHGGDSKVELHEFLGMSREAYAEWVKPRASAEEVRCDRCGERWSWCQCNGSPPGPIGF